MNKQIITLLITMTCAGLLPAQVINYDIDPSFDTGDYFQRGSITNIIEHGSDEYIITGNFQALPGNAHWWTRLNLQGDVTYGSSDAGGGSSQIQYFRSNYVANGPSLGIANEQGQIAYPFQYEYSKQAYSSFISDAANDVLVYQDSYLLVAGIFFTDSTDLSANSIRQMCMIDSTGAPVPDFPMVRCEPYDARIQTLDTLSTGEYIIAGSFTHVNGHPSNKIAKLNADFTVNTDFVSELNESGTTFVQLIDSQDRIWFIATSGEITSLPGVNPSIVRIHSDGTLDEDFTVPEILVDWDGTIFESFSSTVFEDDDGTFILGGFFIEYNGIPKNSIVKINDDGSLIPEAFNDLGTDDATWGPYSEFPGISVVKKLPDGKLLLGGRFSSFGGEPYSCLVRLQPSGYVGVEDIYRGTFKVFPNPANGRITVDYSFVAASQNTVLNVFDYLGRQVYSEVLGARTEGKLVVNTNELPDGVYILEVNQDGIQVEVNKLVIAH